MPQLRKDPVAKRWVIILHEQDNKPEDLIIPPAPKQVSVCPFCEGNEPMTTPEVMSYRKQGTLPNEAGWEVRVVPNKFPALQIEGELDRAGIGVYDMMNGVGAHEVIIESPIHNANFDTYSEEHVALILTAYADRYKDLRRDRRFRYILIFKNSGAAAGASLDHPHSQLIATPIVPKRAMEELEGAKNYYYYKERCVFCDIIRQEIAQGERIVYENENFVAFTPFASRFPFETWIAPKDHKDSFGDIEEREIKGLAETLKAVIMKLNVTLKNPPFNYVIHTSPCGDQAADYYHWHIEIMPRLSKIKAFEWGSGFYINPITPEKAASYLLNAKTQE